MKSIYLFTAVFIFFVSVTAQAINIKRPISWGEGPQDVQHVEPLANQKIVVIRNKISTEQNKLIEVYFSSKMEVDACGSAPSLNGTLELKNEHDLNSYYELKLDGTADYPLAGCLVARGQTLKTVIKDAYVNVRLEPKIAQSVEVFYVPKDVSVHYRIWQAGKAQSAQEFYFLRP